MKIAQQLKFLDTRVPARAPYVRLGYVSVQPRSLYRKFLKVAETTDSGECGIFKVVYFGVIGQWELLVTTVTYSSPVLSLFVSLVGFVCVSIGASQLSTSFLLWAYVCMCGWACSRPIGALTVFVWPICRFSLLLPVRGRRSSSQIACVFCQWQACDVTACLAAADSALIFIRRHKCSNK